jgi:hypothetical protein
MVLPTRSLSIYQAVRCDIPEGSDLEVRKCTDSSTRFLRQSSRCLHQAVWSELAKQFSDYVHIIIIIIITITAIYYLYEMIV